LQVGKDLDRGITITLTGRPAKTGGRGSFVFGVRQKVVLILVSALLVTLTASTLIAYQSQKNATFDEIRLRSETTGDVIAKALAFHVVANDYHTLELLLKQLTAPNGIVHIRVTNNRNIVMAEHGRDPGDNTLALRRDIRLNNERIGVLDLHFDIAQAAAQLEASKSASFMRQILVIAAVLIVELIALTVIIVNPLVSMTRAVRQARASDAIPDMPAGSNDEFGEMAQEFNALHAQLREAHRKLQAKVEFANRELQETNARLADQAETLKRVNEDLRLLAVTDPQTGLYNMRYFNSLVANEIEPALWRDDTHSLLLLRVNNLAECVEQYGQEAAGVVLKDVSQQIRNRQRPSDTLCRLESGEIFLMMRGATMATAISHGDSLIEKVASEPVVVKEGAMFQPALHIGVVTIPGRRSIDSVNELMRCAKLALHACRNRGANCILHYSMLIDDQAASSA